MSYLPYDSGEPAPSGAADASVNAGPSSSEREADACSLPPLDKLPELLRALVERHGRHAFMKALLCVMSKEEMMETTERLCNAQWGDEPLVESNNGAVRRGPLSALQRGQLSPPTCLREPHPLVDGAVGERSLASALHDIVCVHRADRPHAGAWVG